MNIYKIAFPLVAIILFVLYLWWRKWQIQNLKNLKFREFYEAKYDRRYGYLVIKWLNEKVLITSYGKYFVIWISTRKNWTKKEVTREEATNLAPFSIF